MTSIYYFIFQLILAQKEVFCDYNFANNFWYGAFNKFPDFFGMDTFINRTHKKL